MLIYVELYTDIGIFSIISPFWTGFAKGKELCTRSLYFFLYLGRYLIFYLYLFTYCCLRCDFCFYYMLFKGLLFWFFDPIACICFHCQNSMSFCIFTLSLYIFIYLYIYIYIYIYIFRSRFYFSLKVSLKFLCAVF